jgi:hypothetical protein
LAGVVFIAVVGIETSSQTKNALGEAGSEACSSCHSEIYNSYTKTGMANSSGLALDGVIAGEFSHKTSSVRYRVFKQGEQVWMSYDRASEKFRGQRELQYFVGAGKKERSYLFSVQGFLFVTPINWYSREGRWGITPAYTEAGEIPLNLPALVDCVNCHSGGLRPPSPGTENKYAGAPFLHGGITCQRCHGSGEGHIERASSAGASIVNPAKLPPERRDGVCMECHFEGNVSVQQPGKKLYQFQPGERLSDYIHYFLLSGNDPQKPETLSQFEALSSSECKRKSGDKMWCGSCHDPHAEPAAEEKAAYYRAKCLNCHGEAFAATHHADKPDCTKCHMPAFSSKDAAHTEGTDHRIRRYPRNPPLPRLQVRGTPGAPLFSFPEGDAGLGNTRDFALAWQALAQRNVENGEQRAEEYLRKAVAERPDDPALLAGLGFVERKRGNEKQARELYVRALKLDPLANEAAADLAILETRAGNLRGAAELWEGVFRRVPYSSAVGMDLAIVFCVAGQKDVARQYVQRVLEFNPDYFKGKQLLAHLGEEPVQCRP